MVNRRVLHGGLQLLAVACMLMGWLCMFAYDELSGMSGVAHVALPPKDVSGRGAAAAEAS